MYLNGSRVAGEAPEHGKAALGFGPPLLQRASVSIARSAETPSVGGRRSLPACCGQGPAPAAALRTRPGGSTKLGGCSGGKWAKANGALGSQGYRQGEEKLETAATL